MLFDSKWILTAVGAAMATATGWYVLGKLSTPAIAPASSNGPPPPFTGIKLTGYLAPAFFSAVHDLALYFQSRGAKVTGEDLLEVFLAESGCNSHIANSIGCAGLNQICNLPGVGWTQGVAAYIALPAEQQLAFVKKYFDNVNRYSQIVSMGRLYLANFNPGHMGEADDFVLYRKGDKAYAGNLAVDVERKGFINIADMAKFVHSQSAAQPAKWNELRARLALVA